MIEPRCPDLELTRLLHAWKGGDAPAEQALFDAVYPRLRRLASRQLGRRPAWRLPEAAEVVHEVFLRLVEQRHVDWQSRAHFFALAATLIRRVLLDHDKHRRRHKRGAGVVHAPLEDALGMGAPTGAEPLDLLDLDRALTELAAVDPLLARLVELRYVVGLSVDETADALGVGRATVVRSWRFARAFMARRLRRDRVPPESETSVF